MNIGFDVVISLSARSIVTIPLLVGLYTTSSCTSIQSNCTFLCQVNFHFGAFKVGPSAWRDNQFSNADITVGAML